MRVTRDTTVSVAYQSSAVAPSLFPSHGVRPDECCRLHWDTVTLAMAERLCQLNGVDRLVERLNGAAAIEEGTPEP